MEKGSSSFDASNRNAKRHLHRLDVIAGRLIGEGILFDVIAKQQRMAENQMDKNVETVAMLNHMLKLLEQWKYNNDDLAAYFVRSTVTGTINVTLGGP